MSEIILKKDTVNRIIKDVKDMINEPLFDNGIFYEHDEDDLLKGYAMIIGQNDTPYAHGFYFFKFKFPADYPYSPPVLYFCTNDGATRFNPNLYRDGKVCLSVINTWRGEGWSSCQSIRSVLLILQTVLNDKPLVNEPGINEKHHDFINYNKIITFRNYEYSLIKQLSNNNPAIFFDKNKMFGNIAKLYFIINYKNIIDNIKNKIDTDHGKYTTAVYSLSANIKYSSILKGINDLYKLVYTKDIIKEFNDNPIYRNIFKDVKLN